MGFLHQLFKSNRPENLSKVDYWTKWEFFELLEDLHMAKKILKNYRDGYSEGFLSAEDFHKALIEEFDNIEFGNQTDLSILWGWFAPTCEWDDFVGEEGLELGNRIFERIDKWKKVSS